ncbi:PREDICTED: uncharacterized protein LOC104715277 [Camelina sativa]|uniref:Uncharacterized protein LOC104715277 n=1 Tax=Camelina sativa TaxID=90675 RepID=A0ABM0TT88_CAMSA|nr:PREDICTED: uncharacterized protein LOC104715277 [Camelina sativa]
MQIMWATIILVLIIVLSKSIETKGNEKVNDLARASSSVLAPQSQMGILPKPIPCASQLRTITNCTNALKHFEIKKVTKVCCKILLSLPEDCFGTLLPVRWIYDAVLKTTCKALGYPK